MRGLNRACFRRCNDRDSGSRPGDQRVDSRAGRFERPAGSERIRDGYAPSIGKRFAHDHTDAGGNFSAPGFRVGGPYTLVINAKGMKSTTVTDAYVQAGEPLQIPVQMVAAAPQQEAIVITTARTGAREQSQGPITALNRTQIEGVASVNRDVRDMRSATRSRPST